MSVPAPRRLVLLVALLVAVAATAARAADPGLVRATPQQQPATTPPAPGEEPPPDIDVYTMGPGDDLFSRFGHAAICVTDGDSPRGRCYNYGTADFSTPGPLTWGVVRGTADFWVSVLPLQRMLAFYVRENRTIYRQRLPLDAATRRQLAATLHRADVRSATFYHYHHFRDNCTTRIRDLLDDATGGRLRQGGEAATDPPLRRYVLDGLVGEPLLLAVSDLVLGRPVDRPTSRWEGMFLPSVLREEISRRLDAPVEVLFRRSLPPPTGNRHAGMLVLAGLGLALALLSLGTARLGWPRLGLAVTALGLGLLAVVVWGLAIASPSPELRYNEVLLVLWPSDLALPLLAADARRRYAAVRLGGLAVVALLVAAGVLRQPLAPLLLLATLPLLAAHRGS